MASLEEELAKAGGGPVAVCCLKIFKYFTCNRLMRFFLPMFVMATITYMYLWIQFPLDQDNRAAIAVTTGIVVGVLTCSSRQMLCVFCISFPTLGMRIVQHVIFLFISWTVYNVPMTHMVQNLNSTSAAFRCFIQEIENDANKARNVFQEAQTQIRNHLMLQIDRLAIAHNKVTKIITPIRDETKKLDIVVQNIKTGLKNAHTNCNNTLTTVSKSCNTVAGSLNSMCKNINAYVTPIFSNCEAGSFFPCKMETMCDALLLLSNINITSLELSMTGLTNILQLKINSSKSSNVSSSVETGIKQIADNASNEFFSVFNIYLNVHYLGQLFIYLTILYISVGCYIFLCYMRFGKNSCFKSCFCKCGCSKKELQTTKLFLAFRFLKAIFVSVIVFAVVLFLEYAVYVSQMFVKVTTNVPLEHSLNVVLNFSVEGGSLFGDFVKGILGGIYINKTITFDLNPSDCLPDPIKPSNMYAILYLLSAYALIFVFIYFEGQIEKFRVRLAKYFYPEIKISTRKWRKAVDRRRSTSTDDSEQSANSSVHDKPNQKAESFFARHILKNYQSKMTRKADRHSKVTSQQQLEDINKTSARQKWFSSVKHFRTSNQTTTETNSVPDIAISNEHVTKRSWFAFSRVFKFLNRTSAEKTTDSISDIETGNDTIKHFGKEKHNTDQIDSDDSLASSVSQVDTVVSGKHFSKVQIQGIGGSNSDVSLNSIESNPVQTKSLSMVSLSSFKTAHELSLESDDNNSYLNFDLRVTEAQVHSNDIIE